MTEKILITVIESRRVRRLLTGNPVELKASQSDTRRATRILGMCEWDIGYGDANGKRGKGLPWRGRRCGPHKHVNGGEIHGSSMLHVLPAATYGLRPAVNRSNTRAVASPASSAASVALLLLLLHHHSSPPHPSVSLLTATRLCAQCGTTMVQPFSLHRSPLSHSPRSRAAVFLLILGLALLLTLSFDRRLHPTLAPYHPPVSRARRFSRQPHYVPSRLAHCGDYITK